MRRGWNTGTVVLAVLVVVTAVVLALAVQRQNALSSPSAAAAPVAPAPPSVAFVADGYTSGSPAGGQGAANYTALLARQEGWRVTNPAVYGSGYVAGTTLATQLRAADRARPALVVVSGGRADLDEDPAAVRDAATRLYADLRARLPRATVVVIGPMWLGDEPPRRMFDVRDAVRDAAGAARLRFVDPLDERWFVGRDADGVTPDREILTDRGHQRLAELVDAAVRMSGAAPR